MPALRRFPDTIFYHQKMLLTPFIDTNNNQCAEFYLFSSQATVDAVYPDVYPASFAQSGDAPIRYPCARTCFSRETVLADSPFASGPARTLSASLISPRLYSQGIAASSERVLQI